MGQTTMTSTSTKTTTTQTTTTTTKPPTTTTKPPTTTTEPPTTTTEPPTTAAPATEAPAPAPAPASRTKASQSPKIAAMQSTKSMDASSGMGGMPKMEGCESHCYMPCEALSGTHVCQECGKCPPVKALKCNSMTACIGTNYTESKPET